MEIKPNFFIPDDELSFSFVHASGPGGQNVNKLATAVQMRFDVSNSPSLPPDVKARLIKLAGARMTRDGIMIIEAKRYRSQEQNRADAEKRLKDLLERAFHKPEVRHATRPSLAARARRVESKKKRGIVKKQRTSLDE